MRFFVLEYRKRHFPVLYWVKKKVGKMTIFKNQNHGLTPLEKCQFFDFLNFLFLKPRKAFFFVLEIHKRSLFTPILRKKKKVGKMAIFGQEP